MQQQGLVTTYKKVMNKLDSYTPLGYSLCGVVTEVGKGAEEFKVGQLVACAGNEQALHAEYNWVPVNLCAAVPAGVLPEHAAFATVASIAMHGVRRAEVQLGETAAVIGLGLIGQLVVRLLVAAGVQAIGIDPVPERCRLAEKAGAVACGSPDDLDSRRSPSSPRSPAAAARTTCSCPRAATTNGPVEAAVKLARDRARIVDIGKMKLDLPWNAYYEKELDVRFSRSYGPGPVRHPLRARRHRLPGRLRPLDREAEPGVLPRPGRAQRARGGDAHRRRLPDGGRGQGLRRTSRRARSRRSACCSSTRSRPRARPPRRRSTVLPGREATGRSEELWTCEQGRGSRSASSARATTRRPCCCRTWPSCRTASLAHVATTKSLSAVNAQKKFGFATASTDSDSVFEDESLDAIFIVTRHATHAKLVCRALETGKAVFVEKPLALTREETDQIAEAVEKTGNDRLMVGFNRRFAPLLTAMRKEFGAAAGHRVDPVPGQRRPARQGQLVPQRGGRGVAVRRRGRALHRHAQLVGGQPGRGGLRGARPGEGRRPGHLPVRQRRVRHDRLPDRRQRPVPEGDDGRHRRRPRRPGSTTSRAAAVWTGRGKSTTKARGGQDKGQQPEMAAFVEAVRTGAPDADQRRLPAGHHPGHDRGGREPAERSSGAGVSVTGDLQARLVRTASRPDVACRDRLACPRAGDPASLGAPAGASGAGRCAAAAAGGGRSAGSPRVLPRGRRAARARGRPGPRSSRTPTGCSRASGRCSASSGPTWSGPTGSTTR